MADGRADDAPIAPRRTLTGRSRDDDADATRQQAAVPAGGATAARSTGAERSTQRPRTERAAAPANAAGPSATSATSSTKATPAPAPARPKGTRRARLRLVHLDPWSVMKTSLLLSIALGIVLVVAVAVVWSVLSAAGVWDSIDKTVADVLGGDSASTFHVQDYVGTGRVLGFTLLVAALNVALITAISTLAAFLYNLAAALLGGIEVTLAEDDR